MGDFVHKWERSKRNSLLYRCTACGLIARVGTSIPEGEHHAALGRCRPCVPKAVETVTIGGMVVRYTKAIRRWVAAGRPVRSDDEVARIFDEFCLGEREGRGPCRFFQQKRSRCKACGCKVGKGKTGMLNKIRMATEVCPKGYWPEKLQESSGRCTMASPLSEKAG